MEWYNGFKNWETWWVNHNFEFETKEDLKRIEEEIDERYEKIEDSFLKEFIDLDIIDWEWLWKELPEKNIEDEKNNNNEEIKKDK